MIAETLNYLAATSPRLRRLIWRHAYQALNRVFAGTTWHFLSYGYVSLEAGAPSLRLEAADEPDRAFVQLYAHVAATAGLAGKDVLEVSCGRGGGAAFLARYLGPRTVIGLDRSERAVEYCRRHHRRPGLAFCAGDAEALPFPEARFDVVVNVESSHCYGSMAGFLREVRRVLRPGGWLVLADVRPADELPALGEAFQQAGLPTERMEDITANVLASLDQLHERKLAAVRTHAPRLFVPLMLEFAGVRGSAMYAALARREKRYVHYASRKETAPH